MSRLLYLLVAVAVAAPLFLAAREQASRSGAHRRRGLVTGLLGIIIGAVIALWAPHQVPRTPGSPASLLGIGVLWIVGGSLVFGSLALFLGALTARRR